jgi:hypothetical protein
MTVNHIKSLNSIDLATLEKMDVLCEEAFPNSSTLTDIKNTYSKVPFLLYYVTNLGGEIHYLTLMLPKYPTLYLYYICVPKAYRGNGIFKRAFKYLRATYIKKGYRYFALDASEESVSDTNQAQRLKIFSSFGFILSPLKNPSPFVNNADPHNYVLTKFGKGQLMEHKAGKYRVLINGNSRLVNLEDITGCVSDLSSDQPLICPMKMGLGRGNTYSNNKNKNIRTRKLKT